MRLMFALLLLPTLAAWPARADTPPTAELYKPSAVLGADVKTADGTTVGRIVDVLVDEAGKPKAAVVNVGGFLGVGTRQVAVDWANLHFAPGSTGPATVNLTPEQLRAAPAYKGSDRAVDVIGAPAAPSSSGPADTSAEH